MRDEPSAGPRAGAQLFTDADVAGEMGGGAAHCPALHLLLLVTAATPAQRAQSALLGGDFPWPAIDMHVSASLGVHPARTIGFRPGGESATPPLSAPPRRSGPLAPYGASVRLARKELTGEQQGGRALATVLLPGPDERTTPNQGPT